MRSGPSRPPTSSGCNRRSVVEVVPTKKIRRLTTIRILPSICACPLYPVPLYPVVRAVRRTMELTIATIRSNERQQTQAGVVGLNRCKSRSVRMAITETSRGLPAGGSRLDAFLAGVPALWQSCSQGSRPTHGPRMVSNLRIPARRSHRRRRPRKTIPSATCKARRRTGDAASTIFRVGRPSRSSGRTIRA